MHAYIIRIEPSRNPSLSPPPSLPLAAQVPAAMQAPMHYPGGQSSGARAGLARKADLSGLRDDHSSIDTHTSRL